MYKVEELKELMNELFLDLKEDESLLNDIYLVIVVKK